MCKIPKILVHKFKGKFNSCNERFFKINYKIIKTQYKSLVSSPSHPQIL